MDEKIKELANTKMEKTEAGIYVEKKPKSDLEVLIDSISQAKEEFDDGEYILDCYHYYLQAVQNKDSKAHLFVDEDDWREHGSPVWDEYSTFEEFLIATRAEIVDNRLPEIKEKKKGKETLSAYQKAISGFADEMQFADPTEMDKMDKILYDYNEWALNMQKEAIDKFNKGLVVIKEKDILNNEINIEIGNIANKLVSKRVDGFNCESKLKIN